MKLLKLIVLTSGISIFLASCATDAAYKVSSELTAPYITNADNQDKDDLALQSKLNALYKKQIPNNAIDILVSQGNTLLVGQVANSSDKNKAAILAKQNPAVSTVFNYLTINSIKPVLNKNSSLAQKALTRIQSQNDISGKYVKTTAVDGIVYIMGTNLGNLTSLDEAIKGIYAMDGVNKVVNLVQPGDMDYTESKEYVD